MLHHLPSWSKGVIAVLLILLSTFFWFPILLGVALVKLALPMEAVRRACTRLLIGIARRWINNNSAILRLLNRIEWDVRGLENLSRDDWYLVTCNHQSWADIPVLQYVLNDPIPLLKFFLKRQLIWVPLLGIAWWALDFPFMQRYTRAELERRPELRGKDLETTRRACAKFRYTPVTIFNFLEGTRFTPAKHRQQQSPYRHLLLPKAGGAAFVLGAMGDQLKTLLDITIVYPGREKGIWALFCGRIPRIVVDIESLPIPEQFRRLDYSTDSAFREDFKTWIAALWARKDARITTILEQN